MEWLSGTSNKGRFSGKSAGIAGVLLVSFIVYSFYPDLLAIYDSIANKSDNARQSTSISQQQAVAAEIACEKVTSIQDRAICLNPVLVAMDKALAARFDESISGLSQRSLDLVMAGQAAWKAYWPRVCSKDIATVLLTHDSVECISEEYDKRAKELAVDKMVDGNRIYQVDLYEIRTSDADDTYGPAKHSLRFPQFDLGNTQEESNARFKSLNGWLSHDTSKWLQSLDNQGDSIVSKSIGVITKDIFGSSQYVFFYGHGAAHEASTLESSYYLVNEGRVL